MDQVRYIENPFAKIFNIVNPDITQLYNLLLKLLSQFFKTVKIPTVVAQASQPAKSTEDVSVYVGTGGYIYMFLKLYDYFLKQKEKKNMEFVYRSNLVGDEGINQLTDPQFYLLLAEKQYKECQAYILHKKREKSCFSFYMSEVAVWVCGMHLGYKTRNHELFRQNQHRIKECFENMKTHLNKQLFELLYGVPGFLYAVVQLQKHYDKAEQHFRTNFGPIAVQVTHLIIRHGISNYEQMTKRKVQVDKLPQDFRLVYLFHKKEYLGGAHGLGGILSVILSAMKYNDFDRDTENMIHLLKGSIAFLLKHLINGNFASSAGGKHIKLVHFCHGAPGIVTALAKFLEMFPQMGISLGLKEVIETNLNHIWKYGVLKKGFGLCHGISGNAYAFISPSLQHIFDERKDEFLKKAQFFALLHEQPDVMKQIRAFNFQDRMTVGRSDEPYSLMVGIAGDICFSIDVLNGSGYFPGYDI